MARITVDFETGNAAFEDPRAELTRILTGVADRLADGGADTGTITDANGNTVGHWTFDAPDQNLDHDPHEEGPARTPEQVADEENWYAYTGPVPTPEQTEAVDISTGGLARALGAHFKPRR